MTAAALIADPRGLLALGAGMVGVILLLGLALAGPARREARLAGRLAALRPPRPDAEREGAAGIVRRLGEWVAASGLLGAATIKQLEMTVAAAGLRGTRAMGAFLGAKVLLLPLAPLAALPLVSGLEPVWRNLALAMAAAGGMLLPDLVLRRLRAAHQKAVERGLADALDLMVICAEAGLGLETAVDRVARESAEANPALAGEFATTATELRLLPERRQALINLGVRTGLPSARRLGGTLAQTLQYGTPLTQALRTLSAELRQETLNRFEARAARLPVLLTLPTIAFILPCIFLVVGGPAALRLLDAVSGP